MYTSSCVRKCLVRRGQRRSRYFDFCKNSWKTATFNAAVGEAHDSLCGRWTIIPRNWVCELLHKFSSHQSTLNAVFFVFQETKPDFVVLFVTAFFTFLLSRLWLLLLAVKNRASIYPPWSGISGLLTISAGPAGCNFLSSRCGLLVLKYISSCA